MGSNTQSEGLASLWLVLGAFFLSAGLAMGGELGGDREEDVKNFVGRQAPDFSLLGSDGKMHTLSEHRGKRPVVIAWFPKAFTGG